MRFAVSVTVSVLALVSLNRWHPHKNPRIFAVAELAFLGTALSYVGTLAMLVEDKGNYDDKLTYIGYFTMSVDFIVFGFALGAIFVISLNMLMKARSGWAQEELRIKGTLQKRSKSVLHVLKFQKEPTDGKPN